MRRLMTLALIISAIPVKAQICLGADLVSGICHETVRLAIKYSFNGHWTAGADTGIYLGHVKREASEIEEEHRETLDGSLNANTEEYLSRTAFQNIWLYTEYWPEEAFRGFHLMIGGRVSGRGGPELTVGAGYSFEIWRNLGADLMYRQGISYRIRTGDSLSDCIQAVIYYKF